MAYRVAIIGVGKIAQDQHLPVIAKNPRFELAALVSQRGITQPGVPTFATAAEMYERLPDLDAVAICTPPPARYQIGKEALAAGKHVMLEKPPTATLSELADLTLDAETRGLVLFTTWHSQYNRAVAITRKHLATSRVEGLDIVWKEDVRRWHPGQEWIWQPGGFGVFDPGINALSIASYILPAPIFVESATLCVPANKAAPIAAQLTFKPSDGLPADLRADFDWRQEGEQTWDITIRLADRRVLKLSKGGSRLEIDGHLMVEEPPAEYEAIYEHFSVLLARRQSDVDVAPLRLVADAFLVGNWTSCEPFI
ncbi:MAG: Gfo/Idh/MocA family oxidoreductase [Rhizobiales bacterium]|nr:Gfo/Idh/MocA family oxidoreductase [Hyphomicrobiales bacterium]